MTDMIIKIRAAWEEQKKLTSMLNQLENVIVGLQYPSADGQEPVVVHLDINRKQKFKQKLKEQWIRTQNAMIELATEL